MKHKEREKKRKKREGEKGEGREGGKKGGKERERRRERDVCVEKDRRVGKREEGKRKLAFLIFSLHTRQDKR